MFFGDDYEDSEGNVSKCSFDEIDESEIEHFQQMADAFKIPVKITSLGGQVEETFILS